MPARILKKHVPARFVVLAFSVSLALASYAILKGIAEGDVSARTANASGQYEQAPATVESPSAIGRPTRIKIPKISVDAVVESLGLTTDFAMDVPKGPLEVGWFKFGSRPGEVGSAVIAGHYGWKNGKPAAFDRLSKLRKGDKVYVEDDKGATNIFVVSSTKRYGQKDDATDVFDRGVDGKAHLNLITCDGVWNKIEKGYSNRLVIFADKLAE